MKSQKIKVGANIICGVAPGWIFAGHVESLNDDMFVLAPALWIENLSEPWPIAAKDRKKITACTKIDWHEVPFHAMLWVSGASESVIGKPALDTLEAVK